MDGLSTAELKTVHDHYAPGTTEAERTEAGEAFIVAVVGQDEDGPVTRTVCRERGIVAMLDERGAVVAEGDSVGDVLSAA